MGQMQYKICSPRVRSGSFLFDALQLLQRIGADRGSFRDLDRIIRKTMLVKERTREMLGCHNCEKKPEPGTAYEDSPCAHCKTGKNPPPRSHYRDDPGTYTCLQVLHPSLEEEEEPEAVQLCGGDMAEKIIPLLLKALAQSVRVLVGLKERHPQTYRILDAKLQNPGLSYTDLARRFSCKKQNVQYHLKKAVELCPELSQVLIIDTRYTPSYNALKHIPAARSLRTKINREVNTVC